MNRSKNLMITLAALLFVFATAGVVKAETSAKGDTPAARADNDAPDKAKKADRGEARERHGKRGDGIFKDIELTDDQKAELKQMREENKDARHEIREKIRDARESEDREAMAEAIQEMQAFMEKAHDDIRGVLTPEQQEQFDRNVEVMKEKRQQHRADREGSEATGPRKRPGADDSDDKPRRDRKERDGDDSGDDMNL